MKLCAKSDTGKKYKWTFRPRFRKHVFGWRSGSAIKRVNEAVSEIKKVAKTDLILAAEGSVLFLEKVSPALEHVDSSSGAIGTAVNNTIEELASIISRAPADDAIRDKWMNRLWEAVQKDDMPYIELLPEQWGDLCVTPERASKWANFFLPAVRHCWGPHRQSGDYFKGAAACLSSLLKAGRYDELLELLENAPHKSWYDRKFGVRALVQMGRSDDAIDYAENSRNKYNSPLAIASECEKILLDAGRDEEAYSLYAIDANQRGTYLTTFRSIMKKYPGKNPEEILEDLIKSTPGNEGKWFAAAKSVKLYDLAIKLAENSPCDPKTLIRAARDTSDVNPQFAVRAGLAAIKCLIEGYWYEITNFDVTDAFNYTIKSAENLETKPETIEKIKNLLSNAIDKNSFVVKILYQKLSMEKE